MTPTDPAAVEAMIERLKGYANHDPQTSWRSQCERDAIAILAALAEERDAAEAEAARLREALNGNRPIPFDREQLGRKVREAWVRWAQTQPSPKATWLAPYDDLSDADKEVDRQIGECIARWTLIGDAARLSFKENPDGL